MLSQILFILLTLTCGYFGFKQFKRIFTNIQLGKGSLPNDQSNRRWSNMFLFALGQKKMFTKPMVAILHFFIYAAFIFTQIEFIEIIADGFLGTHRLFAPIFGGLYTLLINSIELLSIGAFIATLVFLYRRNIMQLARFKKPEMLGWPSRDANLILLGEIILIIGIFTMNGADQALQLMQNPDYPKTGVFWASLNTTGVWFQNFSASTLIVLERCGWWLHYLVVLGFIIYLPYSKHLHIFLAFPNAYFSKLEPRGKMENIPVIQNEVRSMLGLSEIQIGEQSAEPIFGASDIFQLPKRSLLEAYSCTECGRCTAVCPANQTGKKLSPRKIMMDVRDRLEDVGKALSANPVPVAEFNDNRNLFDHISKEEIYACTTCTACIEACPVLINPMDIILDLRRYDILMNSGGPGDWLPMFNSLENSHAVWQISDDRDAWTKQ